LTTTSQPRALNSRSANYFPCDDRLQLLLQPRANGCPLCPQSMLERLALSPPARTIHREHRPKRDAEHEAADVRPPRHSPHRASASAFFESRVELYREPEQQVDDRRNLDELDKNENRQNRQDAPARVQDEVR